MFDVSMARDWVIFIGGIIWAIIMIVMLILFARIYGKLMGMMNKVEMGLKKAQDFVTFPIRLFCSK